MKKQGVGLLNVVLTCIRCKKDTRFNHPSGWEKTFQRLYGTYTLNSESVLYKISQRSTRPVLTGKYCCPTCLNSNTYVLA